nr:NAD(+)/NADH kinase [Burkholderiales bacterium]
GEYLTKLGINVYLDCANYCENEKFKNFKIGSLKDWLDKINLVIVIGGDGTLLSVARIIVDYDIPILGINQGKLGFMTDITVDEMIVVIQSMLVDNNYTLEARSLLAAKVIRDGKIVDNGVALNDIVISRGAIGNMIEFDINIDNQSVLSQKSDGVIFATPTGSTAYSLAAGGPIINPDAKVFSIVPICPQSLTNRPLVVNDSGVIEFILMRENSTQLHVDGQECFNLIYRDKVILNKHPKQLQFIHPQDYNYYKTLRRKLEWSKRLS